MTSARPDTRFLGVFDVEDLDKCWWYRDDTGSYIDETVDAQDSGTGDVLLWTTAAFTSVNDALYVGSDATFVGVEVAISNTREWSGTYAFTWEYWDGSTWTALSGVAGAQEQFAFVGTGLVTFTLPGDWATTSVNGASHYWVRARLSTYGGGVTTNPAANTVRVLESLVHEDLSQRATDLTVSGSAAYEETSARTAIDGTGRGRAIELEISLDSSDTGVLVDHGSDTGDPLYRIYVESGGVIKIRGNSATPIATLTAPGIKGSPQTYVVGWSTEPNPATTGSSDALRSEFWVYYVGDDEMTFAATEHVVWTADPDGAFAVGGYWDGGAIASAFTGEITAARISARFHSRVEGREHFVAQTAAPSPDGITAVEAQVLPEDATEPGAIVGPQYLAAAASMAVGRNRHRLVSPAIQCSTSNWPTWTEDFTDTVAVGWTRTLSDGYQTAASWLWRRKLLRQADWLRVAVQISTWDDVGGGADVEVNLRVYCSDQPPHLATEWSSSTLTRTVDNGSGNLGALLVFDDELQVRRDADGRSWIWLGASVDTDDQFQVRSLTFTPMSKPAANNLPPDQWGP